MYAIQRVDELAKDIQFRGNFRNRITYLDLHGEGFAVIIFLVLKE